MICALFLLNFIVDLFPMYCYIFGRINAYANLITAYSKDSDAHIIAYHQRFSNPAS